MKTKIEKLQNAIKANRGNVKTSLTELLNKGSARTGKSGYSKGWASKSIWTSDVTTILSYLKISFATGNDAPRGGANGEYIKLTDKTLSLQIKARNTTLAIEAEEAKIKAEEARKEAYRKAEEFINTLPSNEAFEAKWNSLELKEASGLSWSAFRDNLKIEFPAEWQILKAKFRAKQNIA